MVGTTGHQLSQAYQYLQHGKREYAANLLTVLLATEPENADAWWLLAQAAGDARTAYRALVRYLELRPYDKRAQDTLQRMLMRLALANQRTATQQLYAAQRSGLYPAAGAPPQLEDSRPVLRRRARNRRIAQPRQNDDSNMMRWALGLAVIFGMVGCAILGLVMLNGVAVGMRSVEAAVSEFNPSLPIVRIEMSNSQPYHPELGNVNALGSISYYQFRSGMLAELTDQHAYTFTGKTGDFVLIEVSAVNGAQLDPAVAVYGPDRKLVEGNTDISVIDRNARLSFSLPVDGEYTIVVSSQAGTGAYQVTLRH